MKIANFSFQWHPTMHFQSHTYTRGCLTIHDIKIEIEIDSKIIQRNEHYSFRFGFGMKSWLKSTNSVCISAQLHDGSDVLGASQLGKINPEHVERLVVLVLDNSPILQAYIYIQALQPL
jgi:hypothetical protein